MGTPQGQHAGHRQGVGGEIEDGRGGEQGQGPALAFRLAAVQGGPAAPARTPLAQGGDQPAGGAGLQGGAPGAQSGPGAGGRVGRSGGPDPARIQLGEGQGRRQDEAGQGVQGGARNHRGHPGQLGVRHQQPQQEHLHHPPAAELLQQPEGPPGPGPGASAGRLGQDHHHAGQVHQGSQDHRGEQDGRKPRPPQGAQDAHAARDGCVPRGAVQAQGQQREGLGQAEQDQRRDEQGQDLVLAGGNGAPQLAAAAPAQLHGAPRGAGHPVQQIAIGTGHQRGHGRNSKCLL